MECLKTLADLLKSWGLPGLFFLAILDSAGAPLPVAVDALIVATAAVNPSSAYLGALVAVVGSAIGCLFPFSVARKGGKAYLDKVTASGRPAKFRAWFQTYGLITIFIPALVPIPLPLKVFVLSAGALGVKTITFLLVVMAARIPRYFGLAWLGSHMGSDTLPWLKAHAVSLFISAAVLAGILAIAVKWNARRVAQAG
jgi:membrane protein YqaA with SNARE-associated domain